MIPANHRILKTLALIGTGATLTLAMWIVYTTVTASIHYLYPSLYWDQWDLFRSYIDYTRADRFVDWLVAPHNGHRITVARLLFLVDLKAFGAFNLLPVLLMLIGQAVLAALLLTPFFRQVRSWTMRTALVATVSILLFSATQLENFAWAFQIQFTSVFLFAALSFASAVKAAEHQLPWWWLVSALFALLATFAMANGILVWVLLSVIGMLARRWWLSGLFATIFLLLGFWYFSGSESTDALSLQPLLELRFFQFLLLYIGNPLGKTSFMLAYLIGAASILSLAIGCLLQVNLFRKMDRLAWANTIPLLQGLFVLISGLLTTLARVDRGLLNATSERYNTGALILMASLVVVVCIHLSRPGLQRHLKFVLICWFILPACYLSYLLSRQQFFIFHYGIQYQDKMLALEALRNDCRDDYFLGYIYPNLQLHLPTVSDLKSHPDTRNRHQAPIFQLHIDSMPQGKSDSNASVKAILANNMEGSPGRCILFGSLPEPQNLDFRRILFTDADGMAIGSGRTVREFPNLALFGNDFTSEGRTLFYGYADTDHWPDFLHIWAISHSQKPTWIASLPSPSFEELSFASLYPYDLQDLTSIDFEIIEHSEFWTPNGAFPGSPTAPGLQNIWGSWSGRDNYTGYIRFRVSVPDDTDFVLIPYLSGGSTPNATVTFQLEASHSPVQIGFVPSSPDRWRFLSFQTFGKGGNAILTIEESGSDWGQWCAVAAPFVK
jgi:hypothetical protein